LSPTEKEQKMKNQLKLSNVMRQPVRCGLVLAGLMLVAMAASSSAAEVIPPSALPYGLSYEEWSAKWWQFYYSQSTNDMPLLGSPDICEGPASRVRFLNGASETTTKTNHVTLPTDTPLFFAIVGIEADNTACPISDFATNSAEALAAGAVGAFSAASQTTCTIDEVAVPGLENPTNTIYNVVSPPFSFTTAKEHNIVAVAEGEPCLPGDLSVYPAVADGVYLMLSPLSPGRHTIHFVGEMSPLKLDITYDITVE
jgi:hypothetical protein